MIKEKSKSTDKEKMSGKTKEKMQQSVGRVFLRLLGEIRVIKGRITVVSLITIMGVVLSLLAPKLTGKLTDSLYLLWANGTPLEEKTFLARCLMLAGVYILCEAATFLSSFIMQKGTSLSYTYGLRSRISAKILKLPVAFADKTSVGELQSRIIDDVSNMSSPIYQILHTLINGIIKLVGIAVIIFTTNPVIALVTITVVPISVIVATVISGKSEKYFARSRELGGKTYALTEEDFTGFETVKVFNLEGRQNKKMQVLCEQIREVDEKAKYLSMLVQPIIIFTNALAYVSICVVGGYFASQGVLDVGDVVALVLYARMLAGPLESIASGISQIQNTVASARRVYEILDGKEESECNELTPPDKIGEIEFRHVKFSYDSKTELIRDLSFKAKEGQKVAIVGRTGGGKTTIVNLLMRFYNLNSGEILIGGRDITKMARKDVRSLFSMVLQDTWLFSGSVADNVAFGKEGSSKEEIEKACERAYADHFIKTLQEGYNTVINEESTNISGGQKQLLTIARAYLSDRKILILDEATSNVDTRTEILIQKTMDELMRDRTSFVIAHRLSTIVDADVILVVENGDIVEQGNHEELLKKGGLYSQIYHSQYALINDKKTAAV